MKYKTLPGYSTLIISLIVMVHAHAQDFYYRPLPNLVVGNDQRGDLHAELNYQFQTIESQLAYNVGGDFFVFGTFNLDFLPIMYTTLFGSKRKRMKNNYGFSSGFGYQGLGKIGSYEELELLVGYENQLVDNEEYFISRENDEHDFITEDYSKLFAQFNMMQHRKRIEHGFSLKLSYLKISSFTFNGFPAFLEGKANLFIEPSANFHYTLDSNKRLLFTSQFGVSAALGNFNINVGDENFRTVGTEYVIDIIAKVGFLYRFDLSSSENLDSLG